MKAALFDLDGVLVDSESSYTVFWQSIEDLYPTGIPNFALAIKGTALSSILAHYPSQEVRDDIVRRLHRFENEMQYVVYPGVPELLTSLRDAGWATAIVTSSDDTKMSYLYSQHPWLPEAVDTVITGSMVARSKPDPEGYLAAARALGADPTKCVVFEDSLQGIEAGRRAGCHVVAVASGHITREHLATLATTVVNRAPEASLDLLESLTR